MDKFEKYYRENLVSLLPRSNFRQYKFILQDNRCVKIKDTINTVQKLQKHLIHYKPKAAYVSVGEFLNASNVGAKSKNFYKQGYKITNNLFLRGDYVLEIDENDKENIFKAVQFLIEQGFEDLFFVKTNRGIHIHVNDFWEKYCPKKLAMPGDRENYYKMKKTYLSQLLKREGIRFDYDTTVDTRRVVRIPFSLHEKGVVCKSSYNINDLYSSSPVMDLTTEAKANELSHLGNDCMLKEAINPTS